MKSICILGSTGSIGTQTLEVVQALEGQFDVHTLVGGSNVELLIKQARMHDPSKVIIGDESKFAVLKDALKDLDCQVESGAQSCCDCVSDPEVDIVIAAIVGFDGLKPVYEACKAGKRIGLANKETLVVAGDLIMKTAEAHGAEIIPVDSEHSAIFQCLVGEDLETVDRIILTASGGPFRDKEIGDFPSITKAEALNHPNWEMGPKITIDSATMMNKGLEVIEAKWLFNQEVDKIDVVIHPQSIIHSMVEFVDGSYKAQLGIPDMRVPIQYALSFPSRFKSTFPRVDWSKTGRLDFKEPDRARFPSLYLAFDALKAGGGATTTLNAANEQAVALFLEDQISFIDISKIVAEALEKTPHHKEVEDIAHLEEIDRESRAVVMELRKIGTY